jgi:hypothetical protein
MAKPYVIERRQTKIPFPSSAGGVTTAVYPFLGPANYQTLFNTKNFSGDVRMPTGADNADFLHAVYCGPEKFTQSPEAKEARSKMQNSWLYIPQVNIWTPQGFRVDGQDRHGVYSVFDEEGQGRNLEFVQEELERRLSEGTEVIPGIILADGVSFTHRDTYTAGEHTPKELATDGLVISTYTQKGAQQLAEVSQKFNSNPYTWIIDNPDNVVKSVSALVDYDSRLCVDGNDNVDLSRAFSFGVRRSNAEGISA